MSQEIKRLGMSVLTYGVGQVLMRMLMLLLLPVFTNFLTPAEYGVSSLLALLALIAVPLFSLGLGAGMGPSYFEGNDGRRKAATVYTATAILLTSCAILLVVAFFFDASISRLAFETPAHASLVRLTLITACFTILAGPFMQYLQFEERARLYVLLTGLTTVVTVVTTIVLVVFLRRGVRGLIEANFIGQLSALLLFGWAFLSRERARPAWALASELLRLGIVLVPAFFFQFLLQQSNKYVLQEQRDLSTVGIYTVGWNIGLAMSVLVTAFGNAWYAYFMRFLDDRETARVLFARLTTAYIYVFGGIAALFFVFAKPVVMVIANPAYVSAYQIVGFSAAGQWLNGVFLMLLPGLYYTKKLKYTTVVYALASIVGLGLNVLLISKWGLIGAGVGLFLGQFALVALQYWYNRIAKDLEISYEWRHIGRFGAVYLIVAAVSLLPRRLTVGAEIALSCAGALLFLAVIHALLGENERQFIREMRTRLKAALRPGQPKAIIPSERVDFV